MSRIRVLRMIARLNIGGPAIHTTILTERLDPTRFESTLVAGTEEPGEGSYLDLCDHGIDRLVRVPELGREIRGLRDLESLKVLVKLIRRTRPDIVHTHTAKAGTIGRLAAMLCRVPIIVHTYHGHVLSGYFSPAKTRAFLMIERGLARVSDMLIAVSPRVREELLSWRIGRPERFAVVPLGLDLDRYAAADRLRGELRRELGLAEAVPLVGIIARLVPIKAHEVFLAAAARLAATRPDARFLVVGDGERRQELEDLTRRLGLDTRVHFLGWRGDLDRVYADLDVVALCSRNEGSPVALIEAMAAARPVVATAVGGVGDVVRTGESGLLVERDDADGLARAIDQLLLDPALGARMGAAGRKHVLSRYGAQRLVRDMEGLYDRLLASKG